MKILSTLFLIISFGVLGMAQTLEDYQRMAVENNPGVQASYKQFEAAMAKIPQATALPDPSLSISAFGRMVETRVGPQQARFSLSQMFPWFGTLKASGDVAALNAEAQFQQFLEARNKLNYEVAATYYSLYTLEKYIRLEQENTEVLESYKSIATSKFENDEGTLVDVLRVDLMLKEATTALSILRKEKQPLLTKFNRLLNQQDSAVLTVPDTLSVSVNSFVRDSLLTNNPGIEELNKRYEASKQQELLAEKQGLPMLGVGLDYIIVGERTDLAPGQNVQGNGQNAIMPMVTVGLPIFRKKYRAAKKEAQLMQESYRLQKENRINQLVSNYEMVAFERDKQVDLLNLYDEQIAETKQVLNLLISAYSNSGNDFEELLRIQQQLLKYKKMKATAESNALEAEATLIYLIGRENNTNSK